MTQPNPFSSRLSFMPKLKQALAAAIKQPAIGVTQGGSSRTKGAKPAATDGMVRRRTEKSDDYRRRDYQS